MRTISLRDGLRSDGIPASQRDLSTVRVSRALTTNIVPDFPLCNKSFNQSYSGNDL